MLGLVRGGPDASCSLMEMRQGNRAVSDYAIDFRTHTWESSWNSVALCEAFLFSLAYCIKDKLVSHDLTTILDGLIELVIRIDLRIRAQKRERGEGSRTLDSSARQTQHRVVIRTVGPEEGTGA